MRIIILPYLGEIWRTPFLTHLKCITRQGLTSSCYSFIFSNIIYPIQVSMEEQSKLL